MQLIDHPNQEDWAQLLKRPVFDPLSLEKKVRKILLRVKNEGDDALRKFTKKFDGVSVKRIQVSDKEIEEAIQSVDSSLQDAIRLAAENITRFHQAQLSAEKEMETMPGVTCWRRAVAIDKVGLYVPGGTAPLFSTVLMLGIPAALAGCQEIVLCTPPQKDGKVNPVVLFTAQLAGITQIYKVGGAQAIAAMAYGTESVPAVYKIFGPGNQYVNCAKQLVQFDNVAIDMPAGPSEVCVLADESANARFVAADLLSQAEHGADSQVLLVTTSAELAKTVEKEITLQVKSLPRKEMALQSLSNSKAILLDNMTDCIDLVNLYAAEHLILAVNNEEEVAAGITNAGSVFLGNFSPESVGDYASGTNHTLPTNGSARAYSGVSIDSFVKKITYQRLTREGLQGIGPSVERMAVAEGLDGHANAVSIRLKA